MATPSTTLDPLDASVVHIKATTSPKPLPEPNSPDLAALKAYTDHMLVASWNSKKGWGVPEIVPYGPIPLTPAASIFQYGTNCYEGMKLFRGFDGRLRLLRPIYNCERMLASSKRISLPGFEPEVLLSLISQICAFEAPKWLPKDKAGSALYIRPTLMGTDSSLGFKVPDEAMLCIFLMYWPAPPKPAGGLKSGARLLGSDEHSLRAWPKGTGEAKIGANYGPALLEHANAKRQGYDQVLWLFGPERQITEAGSTNVFVMLRSPTGSLQLITPPLNEDKLILAGGTRRNILELSREMFAAEREDGVENYEVFERKITMQELESAATKGCLVAMFVVGTAFWVQPVCEIKFEGRDIHVPVGETPHVTMLRERLEGIVYGTVESSWPVIVDDK